MPTPRSTPVSSPVRRKKRHKYIKSLEEIIRPILRKAVELYGGYITLSQMRKQANTISGASFRSLCGKILKLGLMREATHDEVVKLAVHEMAQASRPTNRYTIRPHPSKINKYIRLYIKKLFVLTDKGRKLSHILEEMNELLVITTY